MESRAEEVRTDTMTDCEITMNDLLNAQLNARIEGIKSERARIVEIIRSYLKNKPKAVIGDNSGEWIIEGVLKEIEGK